MSGDHINPTTIDARATVEVVMARAPDGSDIFEVVHVPPGGRRANP